MRAHRVKLHVIPDQPLVVPLPADVRESDVEVIVLFPESAGEGAPASSKRSLAEFDVWLSTQTPTGRTAAEIDAELAIERASWD